jgi:excisionase family DNA binding protein
MIQKSDTQIERLLFGYKEVSAMTGISRRKLADLEAAGKLRSTRIGGSVKFSRVAVEEFIRAHEAPRNLAQVS